MQPKLLHGECCAIGHVKGAEVARAMGICSAATVGRLSRVLKAYGLPVEMPNHVQHPRCTAERVLRRMVLDKKNTKGTIRCVLLDAIGSVKRVSDTGAYAHTIDPSLLLRVLSPGCTVGCDLARLPSVVLAAPVGSRQNSDSRRCPRPESRRCARCSDQVNLLPFSSEYQYA